MVFETFAEGHSTLLWSAFIIALIMGAVVNKTNFCTMGAVSDAVNMGDWGRMRSWFLAISVAIIGVAALEMGGMVDPNNSFPPYRSSQFIWAEHILGGIMFGIGMTLASGCGNKTLIRIGGGNIKSLFVFAIIGVIAYFMINPFPGSDETLMSVLFIDWLRPLAVTLDTNQDLGSLLASSENAVTARMIIGGIVALVFLVWIFKSADFRSNFDNILGGLVVGLTILAAWYVSSNITVDLMGDEYSLRGYASEWEFLSDRPLEEKPDSAPLSPQSYTFINPMGQTLGYTASGFDKTALTFGVTGLMGIILGSLLWSLVSKGFRIEWFASGRDFVTHVIGATFMGFGGVLGMGCTVGQGITGTSTLAIGSFLTLFSIIFGSSMTMKIQYYKMVYEEEATFMKAFITGLADMKLIPNSLRKLDAI